ncbi:MAG: YraN family protein [Gemmatimonadota bacterium]|jgi:putative endonuclease
MARSHRFGIRCEQLAARHLIDGGWQVLHRNYRFGHREIDLIARHGDVVAFVEVKGRTGPAYGHPLVAVTARKQREIERVARQWIARYGRSGEVYRFDAIAVRLDASGAPVVDHVPDAWRLGA